MSLGGKVFQIGQIFRTPAGLLIGAKVVQGNKRDFYTVPIDRSPSLVAFVETDPVWRREDIHSRRLTPENENSAFGSKEAGLYPIRRKSTKRLQCRGHLLGVFGVVWI